MCTRHTHTHTQTPQAAKKYAKATGSTPEEATGVFASYFATCFLFCEISFKVCTARIDLYMCEVRAMYVM